MKTNTTDTPLSSEELSTLENDAVWSVLDKAPAQDASPAAQPMFARDVMREIRQLEDTAQPWWKSIFSSNLAKVLIPAGAVAGLCAAVITHFSATNTGSELVNDEPAVEHIDYTLEDIVEISDSVADSDMDAFTQEMMAIENEDPVFMTADEIQTLVSN